VFVQIGLVPNTDWLRGAVELSRYGEIVVDARAGDDTIRIDESESPVLSVFQVFYGMKHVYRISDSLIIIREHYN
jgi:hypothetical protein